VDKTVDGGSANLVYTDRRAPPPAGIFLAKTSLFPPPWSAPISPTSVAASASTASVRGCRRRPAGRSSSVAAAGAARASLP